MWAPAVKLRGVFILPIGAAILGELGLGLQLERKKLAGREQIPTAPDSEVLLPAFCSPSVTCPQDQPQGNACCFILGFHGEPGVRDTQNPTGWFFCPISQVCA